MWEEAEEERRRVIEYVRRQVEDWDDEEEWRVRFKGLSGQSSDYEWQRLYVFWSQLILKVARHLRTFIVRPHQLKFVWFRRGPFSPLCLDRVLLQMFNNGELLPFSHLPLPERDNNNNNNNTLSSLLWKAFCFVCPTLTFDPQAHPQDYLVILPLLKEKALQVVKLLSESHWTTSCVITLNKLQQICGGGSMEASAVLSHLSESGKAKLLSIARNGPIEGVKVSISPGAACSITNLDYDVLQLVWTVERLEQQLDVIGYRYKKFRSSALASLRSGDKTSALRHAKQLKLASQGREKCTRLLNQVEEVLRVIADAESSKKVSEAIAMGARAIKENRVSAEEVEQTLRELDENIALQKQVDELLESTSSTFGSEDEDTEDELRQLELDIDMEVVQAPARQVGKDGRQVEVLDALETTNSLSSALSDLKLRDHAAVKHTAKHEMPSASSNNASENEKLKQAESLL